MLSSSDTPPPARKTPESVARGVRRWLIRESIGVVFVAVLLFGAAGRLDWPMAWALVGLYAVWVATCAVLLIPTSPELLAERATRRQSDRRWDNVIMAIIGVGTLAKYIVAGLDVRFGWSAGVPGPVPVNALQIVALLLAGLGYALVTWSMVANAYFSMVSRIQSERSQTVVTEGPYAYVRHPGYSGAILFEVMTPLALGSWWALPIGILNAVLYAIRTVYEDRMLNAELAGYPAYTRETRYRLAPGVW